MEKKLAVEELVKALRCCVVAMNCTDCPLQGTNCGVIEVARKSADALESLTAERDWYKEQLAAALAENTKLAERVPHWISVKDRLPEESQYRDKATGELIPILVCVKGTEYPFRAMYDGKTWGDGWCAVSVLYWMPLPKPPKEETNA